MSIPSWAGKEAIWSGFFAAKYLTFPDSSLQSQCNLFIQQIFNIYSLRGSILSSEGTPLNKNPYLFGAYILVTEKDNKSTDESRWDGKQAQGKTLSNERDGDCYGVVKLY